MWDICVAVAWWFMQRSVLSLVEYWRRRQRVTEMREGIALMKERLAK